MRIATLKALLVDGADAAGLSAANRHKVAVVLILCSGVSMACMMVFLRMGASQMSLWQLMVIKALVPALLLLPVFRLARIPVLPRDQFGLYALRVCLAAGAVLAWVYSIAHMSLGAATAISFSKGVFVLWLAAVLLGERITALKVITTLIGALGVLVILDLSQGGTVFAGSIGVLGAIFAALLTVVIKRLSATEPTLRMMFFPHAGMTLLFLIPALLTWQPVDLSTYLFAFGTGVLGMIGQWCFISAYRLSDVSALTPIEYSRLVFAVLAGLAVFSETPTLTDIAGMGLIVVSSYAAFHFGGVRA